MKTPTNFFDYHLPNNRIATRPLENRDESNLLITKPHFQHTIFKNIVDYFKKGDVVVYNQTKVFSCRLKAKSLRNNRTHEFLFLHQEDSIWIAMVNNGKKINLNDEFISLSGNLKFKTGNRNGYTIKVYLSQDINLYDFLNIHGEVPLPPYILKLRDIQNEDKENYQTVFANQTGSTAAPTAAFQFTKQLKEKLIQKGVEFLDVTLHVGLGTFLPVKSEFIQDHEMHEERIELREETSKKLNLALKENRRITAIGTTSLRVLESCYKNDSGFFSYKGKTNLFIYPPNKVRSCHHLITNFHQPCSTLLMLVSAFAGIDTIKKAYEYALNNNFRFLSYGDGMLLQNTNIITGVIK